MKRVATALAFILLLACGAQGAESPTLKAVKDRGQLICGANGQLAGFGMPDPQGNWTGLDVDFCRAVAAAIFNDPTKVKFVPLIAANRFFSNVPGCTEMIDPYGTDLALSNGRDGLSGAGSVPAVAAIFLSAFEHAQYVWLSGHYNLHRIAWTPQLRAYFYANFVKLRRGSNDTTLWERKSLLSRAPHYRRS